MIAPYDILSPTKLDAQDRPEVIVRAGERITAAQAQRMVYEGLDVTIAELLSA